MGIKIQILDDNNLEGLLNRLEKWEEENENYIITDVRYTFKGLGVVCPHLLLVLYQAL